MREADDPRPGPGEAVVAVEAASINRHDLWILEGARGRSDELPFRSGVDLAGTVDEVGPDVGSVSPGDRVVLCPIQTCGSCRFCREVPENVCEPFGLYHGEFAGRAVVDAERLVSLPANVDAGAAAALPVAYTTAWHMLHRAGASAGDTVFVPGATGSGGVAAIQLTGILGGRSTGTTASEAKSTTLSELGTDHVVVSNDIEEIRAAAEGFQPPT